jgi:PST family polysaccharide transporter
MSSSTTSQTQAVAEFKLPLQSQVAGLARQGINWSFWLLIARSAISLVSTAVLARLLSPKDYGLMAMVGTVTVMAQAVSDFGLSWATVQHEQLERNQVDVLFWVNCVFGVVLTGLCCLSAPYVADFYHRPELTKIIFITSGTLLLSTVAVQPNALLLRQMKLKELNLCTFWSLGISAVITVVLAKLGFGYWALVTQLFLQQALTTLFSFPVSGYFPRLPLHLLNTGKLLKFGGYSAAYGLVNYFARNLDNVLIGKFWGVNALGYYSRAYFLMTLPSMMIIGVFSGTLIPAMASVRKDPARMQAAYLRVLRLITMLGCSLAVGLAVTAPEVVELAYGSKWHAVVPILLWLSLAGIFQPVQNTWQWLYIVAENGRGMFLVGLLVAGAATLAFALGISAGPVGVARAYAIANAIIAYPILLLGHKACGLPIKKTVAAVAPLLLCSLIMGGAAYLVGVGSNAAGVATVPRFIWKVIAGIATYIACLRIIASSTYSEFAEYVS